MKRSEINKALKALEAMFLRTDGAYEAFMDKQFPDERMESIWANMDFGLEDHTTGGEDSQ